jgi:hypothetical protein
LIEGDRAAAAERAQKHLPTILKKIEEAPGDIVSLFRLLTLYCVLGDKAAARETFERLKRDAIALNDALEGNFWRMAEAEYLAWFGTPSQSVAALREAARHPNAGLGWFAKVDPSPYAVIADTPEFKALLADPEIWKPIPIE